MVFICGCGKEYKFATGLSKHEASCKKSALAASTVVDNVKVSEKPASMAIDIPLPKLMPNSSFTQADLELLEKKKQARMLAIQKAEREDEERLRKQEEMASKAKPIFTATIPVTSTSTTTTSTTTSGRVAAAAAASAAVAAVEEEDEEEYPETSERIITFEKMTYLVLALIEQNGQLQKENEALKLELVKKAIISSLNTGSSISPS
jgi:hypothetical protein